MTDMKRSPILALLTCAGIVTLFPAALAQEQAQPPSVDAVIEKLLAIDPADLAVYIKETKAKADALAAESAALRNQAAELQRQIDELNAKLGPFIETLKALAAAQGMAPKPEPQAMAPDPGMTPAEPAAQPLLNFVDDVLPIFEERCLRCHNQDERKSGLSLESYATALEGGSSGQVIAPGNPAGSRLLRLVMRTEMPFMPPSGEPLAAEDIELIRQWIALGAPADKDARPVMAETKPSGAGPAFVAATMVDGPPPMPEAPLPPPREAAPRPIVARAVAASPTAPLAAVGGDQQVILIDLDQLKVLGALPFPEGDIYALAFSVNGEVLLAGGGREGDSGAVAAWNVRAGERIGEYAGGYDTVLAADISPDHRMIALGGPGRVVRVYSTSTGEVLYRIDKHTDWIFSVKFSPDGELLATADRAGNLALWQAANGRHVEDLRGHNGPIHDLAYTIDSNVLASAGGDGQVILWDTWAYKEIRRFAAHGAAVHAVHVRADGQLVTCGADGLTKRWDLNGRNLATYANLSDWVYQTRFGAGGNVVLAGSWSGTIAVWNADTGESLAEFSTNPDRAVVLADAARNTPPQP